MSDDTRRQGNDGSDGSTREDILRAENEGMSEAPGAQSHANPLADQIAVVEKERDELKDTLLRALAETENVRKRANRQIEEARIYAVEKFAKDMLGIADHLARALDHLAPEARVTLPDGARALIEGVDLTQKDLVAVLSRHGVTAIDASPGRRLIQPSIRPFRRSRRNILPEPLRNSFSPAGALATGHCALRWWR